MSVDFQSWVAAHQVRFEEVLRNLLPRADIAPQRLHEAMRYAVLDGGKRVRPLLAFAAGELADADEKRVDVAAAAAELIHAYSLVHDDMPCMDDDVLRRGKPTCHVQYDEATALLVGDALQTLAFQLLAEHRLNDDASRQLEMTRLLAVASGSRGATLGKTAGKDADNDKPTYVSLLGIQGARDMAQRLHSEALETLAGFGDSAQRLRELADFIVLRKF